MVGSPMDRRRAERFAELLEAGRGGPRRHNRTGVDDELASLVETGQALTRAAESLATEAMPTAEARSRMRRDLMRHVQSELDPTPAPEQNIEPVEVERRVPRSRRRFVVAAAVAAGVLGLSGVSAASGAAVPGDALYAVKRSTERAQLAMAGSDVSRGELHLEFARTRLTEAFALLDDADELSDTLADMDIEVSRGVRTLAGLAVGENDTGPLVTIDAFVAEHMSRLTELTDRLTGTTHLAAVSSQSLLADVADRSAQLRGNLLCAAELPGDLDELGPLPGECAPEPSGSDTTPPAPEQSDPTPGTTGTPSTSDESSAPTTSDDPTSVPDDDGVVDELTDLLSGLFGKRATG